MKQTLLSNKYLFALLLSFFGAGLWAQPTLDSTNNATNIGDSQTYYLADSNAVDYSTTTGAMVTWDYSNLWMYGNTSDNNIVDANTTTNASDYPQSSIADDLQGSLIVYRNNHADSIEAQGYILTIPGMGEATVVLNDYLKIMEYPFTFGDSFNDNLAGNASVGIIPLPVPYTGSMTADADGYGTLLLGGQTFNNVLRVKVVETSSADASGIGGGTIPIIRTQYFYYEPSTSKFPVFMYVNMSINGVVANAVFSSVALGTSSVSEEALSNFKLSPNPANNRFSVEMSSLSSGKANVTLLNALGQTVQTQIISLTKGANRINQNIAGLKSGIYFVKVSSGDQVMTKKLMVR